MTAGGTETALLPSERERLAVLADAVLPRTDTMPSAADLDVPNALVDRVLRVVPSLAIDLRRALSAAADGAPDAALERLRKQQPGLFKTLFLVITGAYYLSATAQDRVGYHGQEARTIDVHELPSYLEDGSLERVVARGRHYRDVDG